MLVFRYFYSYEDISCYVQLICISRYELKALYENLYYLNLNTKIIVYAESVAEKPMFQEAYQKRCCLVPASGFYEWRKNGKEKMPYYFSLKNEREPLVLPACGMIGTRKMKISVHLRSLQPLRTIS